MQDTEARCKQMLESTRAINRRPVNKNTLNQRQEIAHDLIINALKLSMGESAMYGGNDVSHLQSSLGKGRTGKPHVLDVVVTELKENDNSVDKIFLVMAPTRKVASSAYG